MQFTVGEWMIDLVVYIDPDSSVADALALMRRRYIHSLIVNKTKDSPNYGIVTSTDICDKIVAQEQDPTQMKVRDIMNSPLITVRTDWPLKKCAETMSKHCIHHLPVVDEEERVVGMISATDFLVAAEAMSRGPGEKIIG